MQLKIFSKPVATLISFNVLVALAILILQGNLPPVVPLFYGRPQGAEQLAPSWQLVFPPLISALIVVCNSLIAKQIKNQFLKQTMLGMSIVVTTLSAITVIRIIIIVGNF